MILSAIAFRNSRLSKRFGRRVILAAGFTLAVGVLGVSWSVRAGIVPAGMIFVAPVLGIPLEAPVQNAEPSPREEENRAINLLMYRDRDRERLLYHAETTIQHGDLSTALELLQRILDQEEDLFVWRKSDGQLASLRGEASRMLENLDARGLAAYVRMVDVEAGLLLKNAAQTWDPRLYEMVARRYFHTAHGFQATHWCATRWFDHGYFELAARAWESLESHPHHARRVTPAMRTKRELARKLAVKETPQPKPLVRVADNQTFLVGARLDTIPPITADLHLRRPAFWNVFQGGWSRSESVAATAPFLHPNWTVSFGQGSSSAVIRSIELWEERQGKALLPRATASFPIVVNQSVIFRDFHGIRCIDRRTGADLWNYPCQTSLQREMDRLDEKHGPGGVHSSRSSAYVQIQSAYARNSVLGQLSSDGQRIYAVDNMVLDTISGEHGESPSAKPLHVRRSNQLVALPIVRDRNSSIQPEWVVGGGENGQSSEPKLEGHFFRGPPLPLDGRLYAVTECRNQLSLVALEAETGKLFWKQGLAFADESVEADPDRYPLACPIAFGDGVLVCPTQTGLLVGVEAITGQLLWSYYYSEDLSRNDHRGWQDRSRKSWGSAGFPSAPKIHGQSVVFLPRQSNEIHCVELRTGRRLWTIGREDGEYIGAVTDQMVFIVGQRYCRGLKLTSGEEQWHARFGQPAGQGIFAGDQYLLPLASGRIAAIDLKTGHEIGLSGWRNSQEYAERSPVDLQELTARAGLPSHPLPKTWRTGNLIPAGDQILACGPAGLIAFPQTGELLNRTIRNQLVEAPEDLPTRLLAAELQLNLGDLAAAKNHLETVLAPKKSQQFRPHGEFLLRELLFRQLETEPDFALPLLDELEALVSSPADRGRFLIRKAEYQMRTGDFTGAQASAHALTNLDYEGLLPWPQNPEHAVSPAIYAGRLVKRIREQLDGPQLVRFEQMIERECQRLLQSGNVQDMHRFLALYPFSAQSASIRQHLAEHARENGAFQRAEFLWLTNRESQDPIVAAEATRQLVELWNQLGLYAEAAALAEELASSKFRSLPLKTGRRVEDFLANIPAHSMLAQAIDRRRIPQVDSKRVEISEQRWTSTQSDFLEAFGQYRREFSLEPGSSFQLLDKGWVDEKGDEPESRIAVINRTAGLIQGKVRLPLRNSYPSLSKGAHVGHFFPVGSNNRMSGVSLLEIEDEKPLWTTKLGDEAAHQHILRVGPAGPSFCTFQGPQELLVLDPVTGKTLWKRSDIDPSSGLVSDPYAGLFGDADVLVLFASNRTSYTVYHTATGEELHHGELDVDSGQLRRIFGSKLFYIKNTQFGRQMRIWDFAQNRLVFDHTAGPRIYTALTPEQELVVLIPPQETEDADEAAGEKPSRLQILDVARDKVLLDLSLPAEELKSLNYVRAFRQGDRFYVNFQRSVHTPVERLFSYYASDSFPPVENIQGDLLAVDAESGKVLWKRTLPQRSILCMPHIRLPFLVTMSRVRDRWQGGKQGLLVEVLDAETGETIALKDNNLSDRVVNLGYDQDKGVLDLNGLKTRIRLKFGSAVPKIPSADEPL